MRYLITGVIGLVVGLLLGCVFGYAWVDNDIERTEVPGGNVYAYDNGMKMRISTKEGGEFDLTKPLTITKVVNNDPEEVLFVPQSERTEKSSNAATDVVVAVAEDDSDQALMDKLNAIDADVDALAASVGKLPTSASSPELQTLTKRTDEMQQTLTDIKKTVGELPDNASSVVREVPVSAPSPELQAIAKRTEETQRTLVSMNTAVEKLTTAVNELPDSDPSVSVREVPVAAPSPELQTLTKRTDEMQQTLTTINARLEKLNTAVSELPQSVSSDQLKTVVEQTAKLVTSVGDISKDVDTLLVQGKDDASESDVQAVITRLNEIRQEIGEDIDLRVVPEEKDVPEVTIYVPEARPEPVQPAPLAPDVRIIHTPSTMSLIGAEGYGLTVPDLERIRTR